LLSYGGTNLVVTLLSLGIVLSLTRPVPATAGGPATPVRATPTPRTDLDLVPARDLALPPSPA
jgi:hypothetical protein